MKQILRFPRHLDAPQELILVRILVTMGAAAIAASSSLYLRSLGMNDAAIGIATAGVMGINLLFSLTLPAILEKIDLSKILLGSTLSFAFTLVLFGSTSQAFVALSLYVVARLLLALFASAYSILFHDDSDGPKDFRKNQAIAGSLINFSWTITPFFTTLIIDQFSFLFVYIVVAVAAVASAIIQVMRKVPEIRKRRKSYDTNMVQNIVYYFKQKRLRDAYLLSIGVVFWWVFIFVFITLYLKDLGYSNSTIGLYLTITQLPLFLFEFKTYKIIERFKYRAPVVLSYTTTAIILLLTYIFGLNEYTLALLVLGSFSMVLIEPSREMYLYEKLKANDEERVQPVYATAELVGSGFVRLLIGIVLLLASQGVSFIVMAILMAMLALHSKTIEN